MLIEDVLVYSIIEDFSDEEFVDWLETGGEILSPVQLLDCYKLLLKDLEKYERYEWCHETLKHINDLEKYCNQKHI